MKDLKLESRKENYMNCEIYFNLIGSKNILGQRERFSLELRKQKLEEMLFNKRLKQKLEITNNFEIDPNKLDIDAKYVDFRINELVSFI